jgi:hypothetical protein
MALFIAQCTNENPTGSANNSIESAKDMKIAIATNPQFDSIAHSATIKVTGKEMEPIVLPMQIQPNQLFCIIPSVPCGNERLFEISVFDANNKICYYGKAFADILSGDTTLVNIILKKNGGTAIVNGTIIDNDSIDTTPPELTFAYSPFDSVTQMYLIEGTIFVEPGYKAIDNIDGDITSRVQINIIRLKRKPPIYVVTYSVADKAGNKTTVTRNYTYRESVQDTIAPEIFFSPCRYDSLSNRYYLNSCDTFNGPSYKAIDNVDGDITYKVKVDINTYYSEPPQFEVTYSVSDLAGNTTIVKRHYLCPDQTFDNIAPVFTFALCVYDSIRDLYLIKDSTDFVDPGYKAFDDVDGDLTSKVVVDIIIQESEPPIYVVTYSVSDRAGNKTTVTRRYASKRTINPILDTTPPDIKLIGDMIHRITVGTPYIEPGYYAYDNIDGNITSKVTVSQKAVITHIAGQTTLYYSVSDKAGNSTQAKRLIIVTNTIVQRDTVPPVLTLLPSKTDSAGIMYINLGEKYIEPGYKAVDNIYGDITSKVVYEANININVPGMYFVKYSVTDPSRNITNASRNVFVKGGQIIPLTMPDATLD